MSMLEWAGKESGRSPMRKIGSLRVEIVAALEDFLAEGAWVERFDEELRALGARLVPKVKDLRMNGEVEISAKANVLGEEVEAAFWEEAGGIAFETSCTCDAGAFCEHGFAMLGKMAKEKRLVRLFGRTAAEAVLKGNISKHEGRLVTLAEREKNLAAELVEARAATAESRVGLSELTIKIYDRVASRQWPVVAPLRGGKCGGCHLKVSSEAESGSRSADPAKLGICDQCGRILYWDYA